MFGRRNGDVVVVTGASAGIGRATVREFARRRCRIALLARGKDGLEAARREVEELGGEAIVLPTDVGDASQVEAAAETTEEKLGPIDIWVNNAMASVFSPVMEMTPEEYRRVTDVTYLGAVYGTLSALRRMVTRDRGTIVQVGSALAYRGIPLQSAYCAAKHAMQGFTESLRVELRHDGRNIHVTMVQLPGVNTPQFEWVKTRLPGRPRPIGQVYQPEVAARAIVWAAYHRRREVYVGYPTVRTIVGNKIAPWYGDRELAKVGVEGQQSDEPLPPGRRDNLWEPVPGDHGAHGRFGDEAWAFSPQFFATKHRRLLGLAGAGLLGAALMALTGRGR
jgi:NAD(P)-dependent dehydrogenase (short-subunit alcohol dehydrogenase family)